MRHASRQARTGGARAPRVRGLAARDLRRLQAAARRSPDPDVSLFGPGSVTWRVNREAALLLGGGRALLMQLAHPLVAAGVAAHSNFRSDPLQRLWRTLELTSTIVFAPASEAIAAVRQIERAHAGVKGRLDATVGAFARGTSYAASRPELLFWVHATLVDSAFATHERFVGPLSRPDANRYYGESKVVARLFGVPDELIPARWEHFQRYMTTMLEGEALAIGAAGKEVAGSILDPPLPFGIRHGFRTSNFFTRGMLPPALRARYGFGWSAAEETGLDALARFTRLLLPALPPALRYFPRARRALAS
jgi:uncharacterized protein (DUF2236 family)